MLQKIKFLFSIMSSYCLLFGCSSLSGPGFSTQEGTKTEYRPSSEANNSQLANSAVYTPRFSALKRKKLKLRVFDYRPKPVDSELQSLKNKVNACLDSAKIVDSPKSPTEWTITINEDKSNASCIKLKSKMVIPEVGYFIDMESTGCAELTQFAGLYRETDKNRAYDMALKVLLEGIDSKMDEIAPAKK